MGGGKGVHFVLEVSFGVLIVIKKVNSIGSLEMKQRVRAALIGDLVAEEGSVTQLKPHLKAKGKPSPEKNSRVVATFRAKLIAFRQQSAMQPLSTQIADLNVGYVESRHRVSHCLSISCG